MTTKLDHIAVCICTFKRPNLLKKLLKSLEAQITEGVITYSIVVADNDYRQSAKHIVSDFAATSPIPIDYCVEPQQNIALARNKALENAKGDLIAFIDDDEIPDKYWLFSHFKTCKEFRADIVLGPVKPYFEHEPPNWVIKGKFFERPTYYTGYNLKWQETRAGNLLFKREILHGMNKAFRSEFGTGSEDVDFFRRMKDKGFKFIWCNDAVVYEAVPPSRCKRGYLLRMALLRGGNSIKHRVAPLEKLIKSLIAVPVYASTLPFLFFSGDHYFMKYSIKFCDHAGRILALLKANPVKHRIL